MGGTTPVAHGGNHASCSWGEPRQLLMGGTTPVAHGGNHASCSWGEPPRPHWLPKTALAPQDRTGSPRPHWLPKTALAPQDRTGSPRPRCIALANAIALSAITFMTDLSAGEFVRVAWPTARGKNTPSLRRA
ncbi:hypothetical protein [Moorena sp. SIO4G3]|uniref:hypothetical protein n=1 Tax=Moorena sp. SIO4G3 TaxID=2607821 RepID=UPI0026008C42|nr:hypothetical protein [Moorena sp. SIO4G3]